MAKQACKQTDILKNKVILCIMWPCMQICMCIRERGNKKSWRDV